MAARTAEISSLTEQDWFLTEEENQAMMENIARTKFKMRLEEFTKAWQSGEFDNDYGRHSDVFGLAMMLPEYWTNGGR